jgi:hypothetical protein
VGLKESPLPKSNEIVHSARGMEALQARPLVKDENQENVWIRQTELFEFIPPTIQ